MNGTDRSHRLSSNFLSTKRPNDGIMKEMTRRLRQRTVVWVEMRPYQGRVVREGFCDTYY